MGKEFEELEAWLAAASVYSLPSYKELPSVPLYMEQVVEYVNKTLGPLTRNDRQLLTSFMVNNYVKARIIKEPRKKKYDNDHLGYLLALTTLKRTLTMSEISLLIEMDKDVSTDKSVLYGFFRVMTNDVLQESAQKAASKISQLSKHYDETKAADEAKAIVDLRDSLGLMALRLSIQAGINQAIAEALLQAIAKNLLGEKEFEIEDKPTSHELKKESKLRKGEAKRLAHAKKAKLNKKKSIGVTQEDIIIKKEV
jgi:hypothetical protein